MRRSPDWLLAAAVANNARWCDLVCRSHGAATAWIEGAWINTSPSPRFYPNLITLGPASVPAQLAAIRSLAQSGLAPGWGVKDSFATLDLEPSGFRPLFAAAWLGSDAHLTGEPSRWRRVASAAELLAWEEAWRSADDPSAGRIFLPSLLEIEDVAVVGCGEGAGFVAGAILNRAASVVGVTNFFGKPRELPGLLACAGQLYPGQPLVCYEEERAARGMIAAGFEKLGALRVWVYQ